MIEYLLQRHRGLEVYAFSTPRCDARFPLRDAAQFLDTVMALCYAYYIDPNSLYKFLNNFAMLFTLPNQKQRSHFC